MNPYTKCITYLLRLLLVGLTKELAMKKVAEKFEIAIADLIERL
jgi:hypothetical protein